MNISELRTFFQESNIDSRSYDLNEKRYSEYVIENKDNYWLVYYFERGRRIDLHTFSSESEACELLREWVMKDPTTRIGSGIG